MTKLPKEVIFLMISSYKKHLKKGNKCDCGNLRDVFQNKTLLLSF